MRPVFVIPIAALTVGVLAVAEREAGAQTAPQQVIYACVHQSSLFPRFVAAGEQCRNNEVLVQWNAQGLQGAQGPAGPMGPVGAQGPAGPAGAVGPVGSQGAQGSQGIPGTAGPIGPAGPAGTPGPQGDTGASGPVGPAGPAGAPGPQGPQGEPGATGAVGAAGPVGPAGAVGATGAQGAQGPAGAIGPIGPAGAQGPTGAAGPAGPQGAQGIAGVAGPVGPAGPQGTIGPEGPQGPQGSAGATGPAGPAGPAGTTEVRYFFRTSPVTLASGQTETFLGSLNVNAGSWLIQAKVNVTAPSHAPAIACFIKKTSGQVLDVVMLSIVGSESYYETANLIGAVSTGAPVESIAVTCNPQGPSGIVVDGLRLIATKVGLLHGNGS